MNNLPWKTEGNKILNCKNVMIGGLGDKDNNELICRAVNNHAKLLATSKALVANVLDPFVSWDGLLVETSDMQQAIEQAEKTP